MVNIPFIELIAALKGDIALSAKSLVISFKQYEKFCAVYADLLVPSVGGLIIPANGIFVKLHLSSCQLACIFFISLIIKV